LNAEGAEDSQRTAEDIQKKSKEEIPRIFSLSFLRLLRTLCALCVQWVSLAKAQCFKVPGSSKTKPLNAEGAEDSQRTAEDIQEETPRGNSKNFSVSFLRLLRILCALCVEWVSLEPPPCSI
jgi:hypothetical protein